MDFLKFPLERVHRTSSSVPIKYGKSTICAEMVVMMVTSDQFSFSLSSLASLSIFSCFFHGCISLRIHFSVQLSRGGNHMAPHDSIQFRFRGQQFDSKPIFDASWCSNFFIYCFHAWFKKIIIKSEFAYHFLLLSNCVTTWFFQSKVFTVIYTEFTSNIFNY